MKQADSSLLFPLLMKALERCVSPRVYTIHKILPLGKVRIYGDIHVPPDRSRQVRIKTHRFCVILDILVGKVNK